MKSLLHQLFLSLWAIHPEAFEAYRPQVEAIVAGKPITMGSPQPDDDDVLTVAGITLVSTEGEEYPLRSDAPVPASKGLVAVVHISGPIMKDDFCGDLGMISLAKWYESFEQTPEVVAVVEVMDSPGGHGNAMAALATQKRRMSKPVVTLVQHGMACSAAYGIASASRKVMTTGETDEVGSIGTYLTIRDYSGAEEARGIKTHTIVATRSGKKLSAYQEALKADNKNPDDPHYKTLRETRVDPFNEAFIAMVKENRPSIQDKEGVFEGAVFTAKKALELGMIDSMNETLESAIKAARELAAK